MFNSSFGRIPLVSFTFLYFVVCALLMSGAVPMPAHAQRTETVLYSFCPVSGCADGESPNAGLIFDSHGNLYGAAQSGGMDSSGVVFELSPPSGGSGPWTETVLHSFCSVGGSSCTDGKDPDPGLVFDSNGNLYGITEAGGISSEYCGGTCGVVFELSPPSGGSGPWTETVIHTFAGYPSDGSTPTGGLIFDSKGNLYGGTQGGGTTGGGGTVFELSPPSGGSGPWTESVLYSFSSASINVLFPDSTLIFDAHGNLYGTTADGIGGPYGGVFELSPPSSGSGPWTESALYSFCSVGGSSCTDGKYPRGALNFDSLGNLYGTTSQGNANGYGAVFELSPPSSGSGLWAESVLYSFCSSSGCIDGTGPVAGVIFDSHGNLYGTAFEGGNTSDCSGNGCGVVFELSPPSGGSGPWTESVLYTFCAVGGCTDGEDPAGLIFDSVGNLYGTAYWGGANNGGVVYKLSLSPATTTLTSTPGTSTGGQTVTFTATVSPAPTHATGLGSVTFKANGVTIGTIGLLTADDGVATLNYPALLPSGSPYSVVATYSGSTDLAGSTSNTVSQTVSIEPTTTSLGASTTSTTYGQSVTFTATVSSTNGITPEGAVAFRNGSALLGNGTLKASGDGEATASLSTAALPAGMDSLTANYTGSALMQASSSALSTITVSQASSNTTVTSSANPAVDDQSVSFTATVNPEDGGTATGTMTFYKNGVSVGVLSLSGNKATLPITTLTPATYSITATYNGSTNVAGSSTTTALSQVVNKASATTAVVSSSPTVTHGTPVTFTATVTAAAPSTAVPPGSVIFYDTFNSVQTELGVGTLSGGKAALAHTYTAAQEGSHSVTATYTGSAYVSASPASAPITQTVD